MNKSLKLFDILLIVFISCSSFLVVQSDDYKTQHTYQSSYIPDEILKISIIKNEMKFISIPAGNQYDYLHICLRDSKKNKAFSEIYLREQLLSNNYTISFHDFPDGDYYMEIHEREEEYSARSYPISHGYISIQILNGNIAFVLPPVYSNNIAVYNSKRTDKYALDYYLKPSYKIQSDDSAIVGLSNMITKDLNTNYTKAKAIHDWVCNNIWYNWDALLHKEEIGDASAVGTLESKKSVCQGYASLTTALLRAVGIPAKVVTGFALGYGVESQWSDEMVSSINTNHAWVEAYINDRWVIIDTTWDSSNKYKDGVFLKGVGEYNRYFDPSMVEFSASHKIVDYSEDYILKIQESNGKRYFIDNNGVMLTGWQSIGRTKFFFDRINGIMATGWHTIDDKKYYFGTNGAMYIGWRTLDGKVYYFDTNGVLPVNTVLVIGNKKYKFDSNGVFSIEK